jgi:ATP-dependent Lon protease
VGKTSLGRSIARAIGRKFIRVSLGGVRDEAEIRGHRRTYIGALPGRIIQGMKKAGTKNPVYMLDEVDKLVHDWRGDPAAALLEALDPDQNFSFQDHYLEIPYDLSQVMFICTANIVDTIPPSLLDRMEVIRLSGYTREEKFKIAENFLVPKQISEHGIKDQDFGFEKDGLYTLIDFYTREAGVRNLEREIAAVCRKIAVKIAREEKVSIRANKKFIEEVLGPPKFTSEVKERTLSLGVATGLSWTPYGGDIIFVEATKMNGKGNLVLTGQLGEVMKESAQTAFSFIRSRIDKFGIEEHALKHYDIHIHIPSGAIPKDGPSSGLTMLVAVLSLLTGVKVNPDIAICGEITLRGLLLPIKGVKEKILAAHRAGIKQVVLPKKNLENMDDIPSEVRKEIEVVFLERIEEVLPFVFKSPPGKTKLAPSEKELSIGSGN